MADHGVRTELCYTLPGVSTEEEAMAFIDRLVAAGITEITWRHEADIDQMTDRT